jgi:hypothetical protein
VYTQIHSARENKVLENFVTKKGNQKTMYPKEEKTLKAQSSNIEPSTRKISHKFGAQKNCGCERE